MNYFHGIMFLFNIGLAIALIIQYVRFHDIIKVVGKPYGATVFQIRDAFAEILFKRASEEFRYRMGKEANHHVMKLAEQLATERLAAVVKEFADKHTLDSFEENLKQQMSLSVQNRLSGLLNNEVRRIKY